MILLLPVVLCMSSSMALIIHITCVHIACIHKHPGLHADGRLERYVGFVLCAWFLWTVETWHVLYGMSFSSMLNTRAELLYADLVHRVPGGSHHRLFRVSGVGPPIYRSPHIAATGVCTAASLCILTRIYFRVHLWVLSGRC